MGLLASLRRSRSATFVDVVPSGARFEVPKSKTILEAALAAGLALPHDCKVGTCGTCKAILRQGSVNRLSEFAYTLTRTELESNFILLCQSTPRGPELQIELVSDSTAAATAAMYEGAIVSTLQLTHDILRVDVALDRPLVYKAGQYANVGIPGNRARSFSFADAPSRAGSNSVAFCVRRIPGGDFTEALFSGTLLDKKLSVDGPHGNFRLRSQAGLTAWIAGGSGLAPILSLLEDAADEGVMPPSILLFGARTERDLYSLDRIEKLRCAWNSRFTFTPVLSHEPTGSGWPGARGLVTDFVAAALSDDISTTAHAYLCGPPGMIDAAILALGNIGIGLDKISYDKFSNASHGPSAPPSD